MNGMMQSQTLSARDINKMFFRFMVIAVFALSSGITSARDDSRLVMPLMIDGRTVPYPVFAIYVMPGQTFDVHYVDAVAGGTIEFGGSSGRVGEFTLRAPNEPGLNVLKVVNKADGETALINVFTLVPATNVDAADRLNGYLIGKYPAEPLRGKDIYLPPAGFVEVTAENAETRVSPNFTLGQFVSKQDQGYPKYVVLRANLLLKLENILATLNRRGKKTEGFVIMSGYRTPFYNKAIGNVPYSRHVWGGAADIYIDDSPTDGDMDDLNGDGRVDKADSKWLADFINKMYQRSDFGPRIGGLGTYGSNTAHGPFVHVDVRGIRARW